MLSYVRSVMRIARGLLSISLDANVKGQIMSDPKVVSCVILVLPTKDEKRRWILVQS